MEHYKPKSDTLTNSLLIAIVMLLLVILGVATDAMRTQRTHLTLVREMQADIDNLVSGQFTGVIGQRVK